MNMEVTSGYYIGLTYAASYTVVFSCEINHSAHISSLLVTDIQLYLEECL